jgi:hypothetical protein
MQLINYDGFHDAYLVRPSITRSRYTAVIICQSDDPSIDRSIDRPMHQTQINHHACRSYRWMDGWMPSSSGYFVFSRLPPVVRCYTYISWTASSMYVSCGLLLRPLNATCYVAFLPSCSLLHKQNMAPDHWLPCLFQI